MPAASCHAHPERSATATCRGCSRQLCGACVIYDDTLTPRCVACARRRGRSSTAALITAGIVGTGALGAGVYFFQTYEPPYDYRAATADVRRLSGELQKEPCDRRKIVELSEIMLRAGDGRGTLRRADAFFLKCGDHPRLRWVTYEAHKRLGEWDQAAAEATKLIDDNPYDADFRGWRGLAYEQKGDLEHAAADFQQALALKPQLSDVPVNLAGVYERLGRPCDAILPLEQAIFYHPEARNIAGIRARVADLEAKGSCAAMAGDGRAQIRYHAGEEFLRVTVHVDDKESGTFIVDTGASFVTLARPFAGRLGLDLSHSPKVLLRTANGAQTGAVVIIDKIEVQGVRASRVPAVVVDDLGGIDGLLGLSFLSRFDLKQADGVLEIAARKPR
jgi:aspartyl protease family protein